MQRIKTISTNMCTFLSFLIIALPMYHLAQWVLLDWHPFNKLVIEGMFFYPIQLPKGIVNIGTLSLTSLAKTVGVFTTLVCDTPVLYGFLILRRAFKNYKQGLIFTSENAKTYQKLGWCFFLHALIFQPLYGLGNTLVCTMSNSIGERYISLSFGTPNLESIFFGVILIIISWVMIEGHRLQSEQELTI